MTPIRAGLLDKYGSIYNFILDITLPHSTTIINHGGQDLLASVARSDELKLVQLQRLLPKTILLLLVLLPKWLYRLRTTSNPLRRLIMLLNKLYYQPRPVQGCMALLLDHSTLLLKIFQLH